MTWEYAMMGLVVGFIIGALVIRFGNKKFRQQHSMQCQLEKTKAELDDYREELTNHFARSAKLLDNMARDYRQLYQHMAKGSNTLMSNFSGEKKPFDWQLTEAEADNDQAPVQIPRDYSDNPSELLHGQHATRD